MISPDQIAIIVGLLKERVAGLRAVYLCGSRAADDDKYVQKDSGYDIAFLASHKPTFGSYEKFLLQGELAEKLKTEWVDLVDIGSIKDHTLRLNVLRGKRLYCADEDGVIDWEAKLITMAQDFFIDQSLTEMQKCPTFARVSKNTIKKKRDRMYRCVQRIR